MCILTMCIISHNKDYQLCFHLYMLVFILPLNDTLECKSHVRFVRPFMIAVYESEPPMRLDLKVQCIEIHIFQTYFKTKGI